jgi:hypothetical protein
LTTSKHADHQSHLVVQKPLLYIEQKVCVLPYLGISHNRVSITD